MFDDGYESVYTFAFPILEKYGFKGVVFPVSGYIAKYNDWDVNFRVNRTLHLTPNHLRTLSDSGWEIGSHGHVHRAYSKLSNSEIIKDLNTSKNTIEEITGKKVKSFCPPFGDLPEISYEFVETAGYEQIILQQPLFSRKIKLSGRSKFKYSRRIYSIDSIGNLKNKYHNYKFEKIKENIIHRFSSATIIVKEML